MTEFFHMGGYAAYVWPSFALTAIVLIANLISAIFGEKQVMRDLIQRLEIQQEAKR